MRITIAAALVLLVGAVSAQDATESQVDDLFARDTYRIEPLVCPFRGAIDYEPGSIECALLQVPENRENPETRHIELHVVKLNSTWDDDESDDESEDDDKPELEPGTRDDPVIYLTGGPGAPVEYYVNRFKDHGIRKHRDMYILEQRGIGSSGDFCRFYFARKPATFNVDSLEKQADGIIAAANDCADNARAAGVDLAAYNTIENARDVKALRRALGFDDWNVWGISYGTILGQAYIKEDHDAIRAIVLDAIVPLDTRADPLYWRFVNWYDRDLKILDELCQDDSDCGDAYPNLGDTVRRAAQAVMDDPIEVEVGETEIYPAGKAWILSDIAAFLPFIVLYDETAYPLLPGMIYAWADAIERRDETFFKGLALAPAGFGDGSQGMYDAIMCNDGHMESQVPAIAADRNEFPILTNAVSWPGLAERQAQRCIDAGMPPRDRSEFALVETDIPTLLIEGKMDPITPPPLAHAIAPGFSNSTYIEFPYAGHGPSRSVDCAGDMLNRFYDDPAAEPDTSCAEDMEVPDLLAPMYVTPFVPKMLVLIEENKDALPGVVAWAGLSIVPLAIALVVLSFAPLIRRLEKRSAIPAGGARLAAWSAALLAVVALTVLGIAFAVTFEISEIAPMFGLVPWAWFGAVAGALSGVAGAVTLALTIRSHRTQPLPAGTLAGFAITALAAVSLAVLLFVWGLGP
ncbi:MAG: alpha/beta fold hydrolase [Woeseiaceae bacterium]|nr:alpha/beta fold hydrolase [Woeseiaceae bacterium]